MIEGRDARRKHRHFSGFCHATPRSRRTSSPYPVQSSSYGVDHLHGRRFEGKVPRIVLPISLLTVETRQEIAPFLFVLGLPCLLWLSFAATDDRPEEGANPRSLIIRAQTGGVMLEQKARRHGQGAEPMRCL